MFFNLSRNRICTHPDPESNIIILACVFVLVRWYCDKINEIRFFFFFFRYNEKIKFLQILKITLYHCRIILNAGVREYNWFLKYEISKHNSGPLKSFPKSVAEFSRPRHFCDSERPCAPLITPNSLCHPSLDPLMVKKYLLKNIPMKTNDFVWEPKNYYFRFLSVAWFDQPIRFFCCLYFINVLEFASRICI